MENKIIKLLKLKSYTPSNARQLLKNLDFSSSDAELLQQALDQLESDGIILRTKGNRYILSDPADLVPGILQVNRSGKGFLQPEEFGATEITIPESATGTALHGDRVLVRKEVNKGRSSSEHRGTVVRILERKRTRMVGTLQKGKASLFVVPDDPRISSSILVPTPKDVGRAANIGDKVVVELIAWENRREAPEGRVIEVLGAPDAEGVDMIAVLRHYDLPLSFPEEVLAEANAIGSSRPDNQPSAKEIQERIDCRDHLVITIDPHDARDFDDAIHLKALPNGKWKLWVHIADVSHYVRPGSALDREARKRGNSTYLVDRVIPMLPEALSNELCSLKPNLDRLTKCVEFELSAEGKVLKTRFYAAVIHSKQRLTYEQAMLMIQRKARNATELMVHQANALAQLIRKHRFDHGSLDLDFPESKIILDEQGRVLRIEKSINDESHQLIEEFMLLANEAVATRLMRMKRPSVYRVHEAPKPERLEAYQDEVLAHHIPCGNLNDRAEIQKLFRHLNPLPIGPALKIGFLKSLMRARYAIEPLGHYGLNKDRYTHFTSPIRRYADLIVHRTLFDDQSSTQNEMKKMADHISNTERNSADAERDSKDVKMYAFLRKQLETGKKHIYSGLVTDIRNFGFFIDVSDLAMSGLVHLSSIQDEFFEYDSTRLCLRGRYSKRVIRLGDRLRVQIYRIDSVKKQVDFEIATPQRKQSRESCKREATPNPTSIRKSAPKDRKVAPPTLAPTPYQTPSVVPQETPKKKSKKIANAKPFYTDIASPESSKKSAKKNLKKRSNSKKSR